MMQTVMNRCGQRASAVCLVLSVSALILCGGCATTASKGPLGGAPKAGVVTLEYSAFASEQEAKKVFEYPPSTYCEPTLRSSERLTAQPVYHSKRPLYATVQLGPGKGKECRYTLAFDESRGTGSGYDTCYVDANNNQDLTDDAKLTATPNKGNEHRAVFPPVEMSVRYGDVAYPYHIIPTFQSLGREYAVVESGCYMKGVMQAAGKNYNVALVEGELNGMFNDPAIVPKEYGRSGPIYTRGDSLIVDGDGDGRFDRQADAVYPLGAYISFGNVCYDLTIPPHGRNLTLATTSEECGTIALDSGEGSVGEAAVAILVGDKGSLRVDGAQAAMPAGRYNLVSTTARVKDRDNHLWRAVSRGTWSLPPVVVEPGKATTLAFGAPLKAKVAAGSRQGDTIQLGLSVEGKAGESYSVSEIREVGQKNDPPPPKVSIADKDGRTLAKGNFEYG